MSEITNAWNDEKITNNHNIQCICIRDIPVFQSNKWLLVFWSLANSLQNNNLINNENKFIIICEFCCLETINR